MKVFLCVMFSILLNIAFVVVPYFVGCLIINIASVIYYVINRPDYAFYFVFNFGTLRDNIKVWVFGIIISIICLIIFYLIFGHELPSPSDERELQDEDTEERHKNGLY